MKYDYKKEIMKLIEEEKNELLLKNIYLRLIKHKRKDE